MRRNSNYFYWFAALVSIFWIIFFFDIGINPFREISQSSSNSHMDKLFQDGVVPVPMNLIMSGEPIALAQDDEYLISYIWKQKHLEPPSDEPYNLKEPNKDPSRGQGQLIRRMLKNMTNGFFVECGALDGETRSNTLFMEQHLNWTGLLVEGDPLNYEGMKKKHRKSWMSNTCLSIKPYPHLANFLQNVNLGKILEHKEMYLKSKSVKVQCVPLFSLLTALNVTTVDYFSLDVEGSELKVLKTIPFDKVFIKTLSVEYIHTHEGKQELLQFMERKGFRKVGEVRYPNNLANDFIFSHRSVEINS